MFLKQKSKLVVFMAIAISALFIASKKPTINQADYPEMVTVEGGTFNMGDKQHTHSVTLSTFKIAKTETTVAQWRAFCNATGRSMPDEPGWGWINDHPIANITLHDAMDYCDWLSKKLNANYRIPTEAEWEFAARGGNNRNRNLFSGGNNIDSLSWYKNNSGGTTHPVGLKKPNELGLYDMSGNVSEWCMYQYKGEKIDPQSKSDRVFRGGSFIADVKNSYIYIRNVHPGFTFKNRSIGFRVVLSQ